MSILQHHSVTASPDSISEIISDLSHWLLSQGPIKDFIHHNTLHAYQDRPFHDGVRIASRMYGARGYLPLTEYRERYRKGEISESALNCVLNRRARSQDEFLELKGLALQSDPPARTGQGIAGSGLRSRWEARGIHFRHQVQPSFFRLVSAFLDQGVSAWRMPHTDLSLFASIRKTVESSWLPLPPFAGSEARALLTLEPEVAIERVLRRFVGSRKHFRRYLCEMLLEHPGWSGMIHAIETAPETLVDRRRASLLEFCALELIAEYGWVISQLDEDFDLLINPEDDPLPIPAEDKPPAPQLVEVLQEIWQEAFERSYAEEVVAALSHPPVTDAAHAQASDADVYFCIDDRECSFRRHLEAVNPAIRTYGAAGFFGIDCVFQGADDAFPHKHCPVPVNPRHLIREVSERKAPRSMKAGGRLGHLHLESRSNTFVRGWLISQTLGLFSALKLALSIFRPTLSPATASSLQRVQSDATLVVERNGSAVEAKDFLIGYTPEEMADRIGGLLRNTGALVRPLSELVVLFGHGASSVNNPYFAAYDCGACSGKPGAPNARAFALMANHPDVRRILRDRGVEIPERTWFVGALHDTTRDEVQYYEVDRLPTSHHSKWQEFTRQVEVALKRNAKERCRRFELVPLEIGEEAALDEVRQRSISIFEPRPELNHATNASCLIGTRDLTRGLFLDRRSFMHSYDSTQDRDGSILAAILGAVVPVCGGINLEYYFSRVDSEVYGAGTKLPQNVNGLIGVTSGTEGDLRMGLPTQMTEVHDPLRLLFVVEQKPEVALKAVRVNPAVYEWVRNRWVQYFVIDPETREAFEYLEGAMVPVHLGSFRPRTLEEGRGNLPLVRMSEGHQR